MIVSSRQNEQVKRVRALRLRKERDETGLFFVEGLPLLDEAAAQQFAFETLVTAPAMLDAAGARRVEQMAQRTGAPRLDVTPEVFETISYKEGYGGVGAVLRQRWRGLERAETAESLGWVALSEIGYPFNLGTILRVCDAAGAAGVLLIGPSTDPYDPVAVRASLGAVFSQQVVRTSFEEFAAWARRSGCPVIGTSPSAPADYRAVRYPRPLALLMGGERIGLSDERQSLCETLVRIPMAGRVPSHHVAVATAIVLYEAFTQHAPSASGGPNDVSRS